MAELTLPGASPAAVSTNAVVAGHPEIDQEAIQRAVREAVRAELARARPGAHADGGPAPALMKTAENVAATDRGHRLVADAVGARKWTRADAEALRRSLEAMDAEDRDAEFFINPFA